MSTRLDRPALQQGWGNEKVYIVTHGKQCNGQDGDYLDPTRKYDVTRQIIDIATQLGWQPPNEKE